MTPLKSDFKQDRSEVTINLFDMLLESCNDYIFFKDKEHRIIKTSRNIAKIFNAESPDDLIGKTDEYFFPDIAKEAHADEMRIMESGEPMINVEMDITFPDGLQHTCSVTKVPYYDDEGNVSGIIGIARDLTEEKRLEKRIAQTDQQFKSLFENAAFGIGYYDLDGRIISLNRKSLQNLGVDNDTFSGKHVTEAFGEEWGKKIQQRIDQIASMKKNAYFDDEFIDLKGNKRYYDTGYSPTYDERGRVNGVQIIANDITHQKEMEQQIEKNAMLLSEGERIGNIGYWDWNFKTNQAQWSDGLYKIYNRDKSLGLPPIANDQWLESIHPDDQQRLLDTINHSIKTKEPYVIDYRIHRYGDKKIRYIHAEGEIFCDESGESERLVGVVQDVTDRVLAEKEVKDAKVFYESVIETVHEGIWVTDRNDVMTFMNRGMETIAGVGRDACVGLNVLKDFPDETNGEFKLFYLQSKKTMKSVHYEAKVKTPAGKHTIQAGWLLPTIKEGRFNGMICTIQDITERKKIEQDKSIILDSMNELFCCYTPDLKILWTNKAAADSLGLKQTDIIGKHCYSLWNQCDTPCEDCPVLLAKKTKRPQSIERQTPDGRHWQLYGYPILDENGDIKYLVELGLDITEKKIIKQKLQRIFDMSSDLICEADINTATFTKINPAFSKILGYEESELLSKSFLDFIHPDDKESTMKVIEEQLQQGQKVLSFVNRYRCKDGSYVVLDWNSHPVPEEGFTYAIARDVTQKKRNDDLLKKRDLELTQTLNATTDGIWTWNFKTDTLFFSPKYYTMLGYEPDEFSANFENWSNLIHPDDKDSALEVAEEYLKTKPDEYENEFRMKTKKGDYRWIHTKARVVERDKNGEAVLMIGNHEDITRQKAYEKQLKNESEKFRTIFNSSSDALCIHSIPDMGILDVNEEAIKRFEYSKDEFKNLTVDDLSVIPAFSIKSEEMKKTIQKVLDGETQIFEWLSKTKSGIEIWHLMTLKSIELDGEKRIMAQAKDIRAMKKSQERVIQSEQKFRTLFNSSSDAVFIHSIPDLKIIDVNDEACKRFGFTKEEMQKVDIDDISVSPSFSVKTKENQELLQRIFAGETLSGEWLSKTKQGKQIWHYMTFKLIEIDGEKRLLAQARNITELKKGQERLIKSEKRLKEAEETGRIGHVEWDCITQKAYWSDVIFDLYERDPALGTPSYDEIMALHAPTDAKRLEEAVIKALESATPYALDLKVNLPSAKTAYFHIIGEPITDEKGTVIKIKGTVQDITERKQIEDALRESEAKNHSIVDNVSIGVALIGPKMEILQLNNQMKKWFPEIDENEKPICYQSFNHPPKESICEWCPTCKTLEDGTVHKNITKTPTVDGIRNYRIVSSPIFDDNGNVKAAIEMVDDITDVLKAEQRIKQANQQLQQLNRTLEDKVQERTERIEQILEQKDEFINQLGHDLKNPLGPLLNLLPILEENEKDPKRKEILSVINRNVSYMKNLVTKTIQLAQLKSPHSTLHLEPFNLNEELDGILKTNQMMFEEKHLSVKNNIPKDCTIYADKLKLHEVFNNILNNSVKYTDKKDSAIIIDQTSNDKEITISVTDKGIGMTKDQVEKVFNEFYKADTSRHDFDSSGLGMPISKRIIEMHKGNIWVESPGPGKGSTFYFTLPLHPSDE